MKNPKLAYAKKLNKLYPNYSIEKCLTLLESLEGVPEAGETYRDYFNFIISVILQKENSDTIEDVEIDKEDAEELNESTI
jgi:hypothetical protein